MNRTTCCEAENDSRARRGWLYTVCTKSRYCIPCDLSLSHRLSTLATTHHPNRMHACMARKRKKDRRIKVPRNTTTTSGTLVIIPQQEQVPRDTRSAAAAAAAAVTASYDAAAGGQQQQQHQEDGKEEEDGRANAVGVVQVVSSAVAPADVVVTSSAAAAAAASALIETTAASTTRAAAPPDHHPADSTTSNEAKKKKKKKRKKKEQKEKKQKKKRRKMDSPAHPEPPTTGRFQQHVYCICTFRSRAKQIHVTFLHRSKSVPEYYTTKTGARRNWRLVPLLYDDSCVVGARQNVVRYARGSVVVARSLVLSVCLSVPKGRV